MSIINGIKLDNGFIMESYDFKLTNSMKVGQYKKVGTIDWKIIQAPLGFPNKLLFELNYVHVDPKLENNIFLKKISNMIRRSGVKITNIPNYDDMRICYQPIGNLSNSVRFYITRQLELVFLSPAVKLKLIN